MTAKERKDFNQMKQALTKITSYQSAESLRERSEKDWGGGGG